MSVNFEQEPVGGVVLIIPAIQSAAFVSDTSGWQINADGSAQFNGGLTVTGGTIVLDYPASLVSLYPAGAVMMILDTSKAALLIYADTGTAVQGALVFAYAALPGTDTFGNPFNQGLTLGYVGVPATDPPAGSVSIYIDGSGNLKALTQAGNTRTIAAV